MTLRASNMLKATFKRYSNGDSAESFCNEPAG